MRTTAITHGPGTLRWLMIGALAVSGVALLARCGGDDEDQEPTEEDTIGILPAYDFQLGGPLGGDAGQSVITISIPEELNLSTQPSLQGRLTCDQQTETCALERLLADSRILVDDQSDPETVGDFEVVVDEDWVYAPPGADEPTSGRVRIDPLGAELADIFVEVDDCGTEGNGLRVTTGTASACYPWDDFDDLLETGDTTGALAALGWGAFDFTLEQMGYTLEAFGLVDEYAEILKLGDPVLEQCDTYSATWPTGPANPGNFLFSWRDDNPNGEPGPGDSFRLTFSDCWDDDEGSDVDELLNGVIDLVGYTEVVENNLITRIGFETPFSGSTAIGGVAYGDELGNDPFTITETEEENGVISTASPMTLTGRYIVVFFE